MLVTVQAVYLKLPSLASVLHKTWAKISFTGASVVRRRRPRPVRLAGPAAAARQLPAAAGAVGQRQGGRHGDDRRGRDHALRRQRRPAEGPRRAARRAAVWSHARHGAGPQGGPHQRLDRRPGQAAQAHPGACLEHPDDDDHPAPVLVRAEGLGDRAAGRAQTFDLTKGLLGAALTAASRVPATRRDTPTTPPWAAVSGRGGRVCRMRRRCSPYS